MLVTHVTLKVKELLMIKIWIIKKRHAKFFSGGQNDITAISSTSLNGYIFRGYQDFSSKVKNCFCIDCNGLCVCDFLLVSLFNNKYCVTENLKQHERAKSRKDVLTTNIKVFLWSFQTLNNYLNNYTAITSAYQEPIVSNLTTLQVKIHLSTWTACVCVHECVCSFPELMFVLASCRWFGGCILTAVCNVPMWGLSLQQTGTTLAPKHLCTQKGTARFALILWHFSVLTVVRCANKW